MMIGQQERVGQVLGFVHQHVSQQQVKDADLFISRYDSNYRLHLFKACSHANIYKLVLSTN